MLMRSITRRWKKRKKIVNKKDCLVKFDQNGQWRLVPNRNPYDAVDNPEKYANRDDKYTGISSQVNIDESEQRDIKVYNAKVFRDHQENKNPENTSTEAVSESEIDHTGPVEDLPGIEKYPPQTKTVGILYDGNGNRKK